jgi:amino acid transporter
MLGAGPFFTIPVLLATMHGPQAMLSWFAAMVIVICDGLVWSELGAAFPGSGATYHSARQFNRRAGARSRRAKVYVHGGSHDRMRRQPPALPGV